MMSVPLRSPDDVEALLSLSDGTDPTDFSEDQSLKRSTTLSARDSIARIACTIFGLACLVLAGLYLKRDYANSDWLPAVNPPRTDLRFPESGQLKLVVFADLHWGERPETDWGPDQDVNSTRVIRSVLDAESPDLVIFSGDQLTGEFMSANGTQHFHSIAAPLVERNVSWASAYGNHDVGKLLPQTLGSPTYDPAFPLSLLKVEQSYPNSLTKRGPLNLAGTTNYVLPILSSGGNTTIAYLWFLDSGLSSVSKAQVSWLRSTYAALDPATASAATHVMFVHIPTKIVAQLQSSPLFTGPNPKCSGLTDEPHPGVQPDDHNLFVTLGELHFTAVYSGHDHGTTFCCVDPSSSIQVCMGRRSGYGGYGEWERGARVVVLNERGGRGTWVRMEDGRVLVQ
jgi:hypothetical protein